MVDQAGDDQCLDQELRCVRREEKPDPADVVEANLQDQAKAVMLGMQDNLSSRITLRFLAVDESDTVVSLRVTDRSM